MSDATNQVTRPRAVMHWSKYGNGGKAACGMKSAILSTTYEGFAAEPVALRCIRCDGLFGRWMAKRAAA